MFGDLSREAGSPFLPLALTLTLTLTLEARRASSRESNRCFHLEPKCGTDNAHMSEMKKRRSVSSGRVTKRNSHEVPPS
jgi:hypothetical protein